MPNITLSIPDDVYRRMKRHPEVRWSEVARRAIIDYLRRIEGVISSGELLEDLGEDFKRFLDKLSLDDAVKFYERLRELDWRRFSTIQESYLLSLGVELGF